LERKDNEEIAKGYGGGEQCTGYVRVNPVACLIRSLTERNARILWIGSQRAHQKGNLHAIKARRKGSSMP